MGLLNLFKRAKRATKSEVERFIDDLPYSEEVTFPFRDLKAKEPGEDYGFSLAWLAKNGTGGRGIFRSDYSFEETIARLKTLSGSEPDDLGEYKCSVEFVGVYKGEVFTVYDWKRDRQIHIGGSREIDYDGLIGALYDAIADSEPTPYKARYDYESYEDYSKNFHEWK